MFSPTTSKNLVIVMISLLPDSLKFLQRYPELPVVAWCDFMKCGRMTATEMDEYSSLLAHILHARYKACVALVIAPYLVSEKQEGYRGQLRTGRLLD